MSTLPSGLGGATAFQVAERAVRSAGRVAMERFRSSGDPASSDPLTISYKGRNEIVTDADLAAEAAALAVLRQEFPQSGTLAEESAPTPGQDGFTWVLDPIDGTRNFAVGVPHFAVNLALARGDQVLLGLTYDPVSDELFHAEAGQGALLNGRPMTVSSNERLEMSVLGFDMGYVDEQAKWMLEMVLHLWPGMQAIRIMGSAALGLAYVAAGRIDLYVHHHLGPWDLAPGLLLVAEAGGVATDLKGAPATLNNSAAIAANRGLHARFMAATADTRWRHIP